MSDLPFPFVENTASIAATERDGLGLATVLERRGRRAALVERVRERFGIELPRTPNRLVCGRIAFVSTGPGAWLATCEGAGNGFALSLREGLDDLASISDQSDGYAVLRVAGQFVRDALCKLVPIDLHPRVFGVGDVAATVAAHIPTILWRLQNDANGSAVFEIACYRSFSKSFRLALSASAAEFGLFMSGDT